MSEATSGSLKRTVWDWPTRVVHWAIAVMVFCAWATATYGRMEWHRYCGYGLLGLIIFRLYWGVFGSTPSRFSTFVRGPKAVAAYVRTLPDRASPPTLGHNPLGALSVLALLAALIAEVTLGLFAVDVDGIESGPLSVWVSFEAGRFCASAHHLLFNVLVGLIGLHLCAILFYATYKRDNLVGPMVHGRKSTLLGRDFKMASGTRAAVGAALALAIAVMTARAFKM